jgi:hypothetical protein
MPELRRLGLRGVGGFGLWDGRPLFERTTGLEPATLTLAR